MYTCIHVDITLHYSTLITLHYIHTLHYIPLHCIALHYIALHSINTYITWHDMTRHDTTGHDMTLRYVTLHYNYIQDASTCIFTFACRSPWMLVQPGICPRCFAVSNTASVGEGEPRRHEGEQGSQQHTAKGPRQGTGTSTRRGGERRLWDWIHGPFGNGWCIEYCSGSSGPAHGWRHDFLRENEFLGVSPFFWAKPKSELTWRCHRQEWWLWQAMLAGVTWPTTIRV